MKLVSLEVRRFGAATLILDAATLQIESETQLTNSEWRSIVLYQLIRWIAGLLSVAPWDGEYPITMSYTLKCRTGEPRSRAEP